MNPVKLSESLLQLSAPTAIKSDGGRFYSYVKSNGSGQFNISWWFGFEKAYKFFIPSEYLKSNN